MRVTITVLIQFLFISLEAVTSLYAQAIDYKELVEVIDDIKLLAQDNAGDAIVSELKDVANNAIKTEGSEPQSLWLLKIAQGNQERDNNILITGTHHAREWVSYKTVLYAARFILANKTLEKLPAVPRFTYFRSFKEMNIKALLENANLYFVPVVNSEGYQYSFVNEGISVDAGWRKNRRITADDPWDVSEDLDPPYEIDYTGVDTWILHQNG